LSRAVIAEARAIEHGPGILMPVAKAIDEEEIEDLVPPIDGGGVE
jgi:hypothetical protein